MAPKVAVVVPVHNFVLSEYEQIGLRSIREKLRKYPKYLIYPQGGKVPARDWAEFKPIEIMQDWGAYGKATIQSYSRLLRSRYFYELFQTYDFILIAQLDVYIFGDDLSEFTQLDYDYWGAPWFMELYWHYPYLRDLVRKPLLPKPLEHLRRRFLPQTVHRYVGNGGLSLRRVARFLAACKTQQRIFEEFDRRIELWQNLGYDISFEDNFWCLFFPKHQSQMLKFPPWKLALRFAFETGGPVAYKINNQKLPFGVHAWFKHERLFWSNFIP